MLFTSDAIVAYDNEAKRKIEQTKQSIMSDIISGRIPSNQIAHIPLKYLDITRLPGVPEHNIMTPSRAYKPFRYEFGFQMFERQNQIHWLPESVPLNRDIVDWKTKLSNNERNLMTHMMPLFVQNDVMVGNAYGDQYWKIFRPVELQLAIGSIINAEGIHQAAYSHLFTELGFPETHYSKFLEYQEMSEKYDFTAGFKMDTLMGIAVAMLVFGALTEGVQLFASFITLFSFSRRNRLMGMGQLVSWSVKDESLHVSFVAMLFKYFIAEYGHLLDMSLLMKAADDATRQIIKGEHKFADLAFEFGDVENMKKDDLKQYVCNIADFRRSQFGLPTMYNVSKPFEEWSNSMMGGIEHANFFEQRSTAYSRAATRGNWDEAFPPPPLPPTPVFESAN